MTINTPDLSFANLHQVNQNNNKTDNVTALNTELEWFSQVLNTRLLLYFENECEFESIYDLPPPDYGNHSSAYVQLINEYEMNFEERLLLMLALAPQLSPHSLNMFLVQDQNLDRPFAEFGGWKGEVHSGFLPTLETAAFLLAGNNLAQRLNMMHLLNADHYLIHDGILDLQSAKISESWFTSPITVSAEYFQLLTTGEKRKPDFNSQFPATRLQTNLDWQDLVLTDRVMNEVEHIRTWIQYQHTIQFEMGLDKSIRPGYRTLFYGPPGTGKTLTAGLLGKVSNLDVYRIDLSAVLSKYIGETEKNLEQIFRQAENRQWILFFDEADGLFGKRTQTSSANDRFANQEIAYLLQRIEFFPGMIILATNFKANIDEAFARRFQSMVYFPVPDENDRQLLWYNALSGSSCVEPDINFDFLAAKYELTGGAIINAIHFATTHALRMNRRIIKQEDLIKGIEKELRKEGKTL